MAPRWFQSVKFGRDIGNFNPQDFTERFKTAFEKRLGDYTIASDGPVIEEVLSEVGDVLPPQLTYESEQEQEEPSKLTHESEQEQQESPKLTYEPEQEQEESPQLTYESEQEQEEPSKLTHESEQEQQESPKLTYEPEQEQEESPKLTYEPEQEQQESQREVPDAPRRSDRKRWAPLDYARGQRPIYRRNGAAFEVVGFEEGFPIQYNYGRRGPHKKAKVRAPANCEYIQPPEYKAAQQGAYEFYADQSSSLITGNIKIPKGKSKPETKTSIKYMYIFLIQSGQVVFKINGDSYYADQNSGFIKLGEGQRYSIRNHGSQDATIAYIVNEK